MGFKIKFLNGSRDNAITHNLVSCNSQSIFLWCSSYVTSTIFCSNESWTIRNFDIFFGGKYNLENIKMSFLQHVFGVTQYFMTTFV